MTRGTDVIISETAVFKRPDLIYLGSRVAIDYGFYCTTNIQFGDYIHVGPHVSCIGGLDGIFIAEGFNNIMAGVRIICCSDRFDDSGLFGVLIPKEYLGNQVKGPVIMEPFSNLGTNAVMLPDSRLRKGALLTVGSVLFGDTKEWGIYKGNPAKLDKVIDGRKIIECAEKLGYKFL